MSDTKQGHPWHPEHREFNSVDCKSWCIIDSSGDEIAVSTLIDDKLQEANARLMAAGPELLAAAKEAINGTDDDKAIQMLEAAIRSAEG